MTVRLGPRNWHRIKDHSNTRGEVLAAVEGSCCMRLGTGCVGKRLGDEGGEGAGENGSPLTESLLKWSHRKHSGRLTLEIEEGGE